MVGNGTPESFKTELLRGYPLKIYKLLPLILLLVCAKTYGAYTGTMPKDIGTSTPLGSENPNVLDDVDRELKTIVHGLYKLKFVGTNTTLAANDTWVIGSSSTAMLITMPAASSCANSSVTKPFVIKNYSTGTITLNISVDGVGSPTVVGSQTMSLFTDGTNWYEIGAKNSYDSEYLGGVIASGYARSGANSDITSITGLTTYLAVGQGGSGTNTAAGAASAFGVGTEDSPTFTGVTATTGSTTTHTSTTITATTGNITNVSATAGTFTGNLQVGSMSGLEDADIPNDATLTNITQVTNRSHNDITGTGTYSHTNIDSHIDDTSDPHGASLTQTNATITTGTTTTFYSTTANITTGNITNLVTTVGTVSTLNNTNISGGAGTFTGNVQMASATGFDYLKHWRVGSTVGTGSLNFAAGLGITLSPTYGNGNGTITVTASGTSSAGGWTHTGTQTVGITGSEILPHGTVTLDPAYGISGLTDAWIPDVITLTNITQIGTRQLADMQGLLSIATQTTGVTFSTITGTPTDNSYFSTTPAANKSPYTGTSTDLNSWVNTFTHTGTNVHPGSITESVSLGTTTANPNTILTVVGTSSQPISLYLDGYELGIGTDTIPIMTSNTVPSGIAYASSEFSADYAAWKCMDNNTAGTYWQCAAGVNTGVLRYDYGTGTTKIIGAYIISVPPASASVGPKAWTFEGSNNLTSWTVLDTRGTQTPGGGGGTRYTFLNTSPYQMYRLNITENNGNSELGIWEVVFLENQRRVSLYNYKGAQLILGSTTSITDNQFPLEVVGSACVTGGLIIGTTTNRSVPLLVKGYNNSIASIIQIDGAIDSTGDVFVSFRDNTNSEQGSIACSGVANVVAYNTSLDTHYTYVVDKTGLSSLDVLEREGGVVGKWNQLYKLAWSEVDEPNLDISGNPIYDTITESGTGTTLIQRFKKVTKLVRSDIKIEGQSPKNQIPLSKICSTYKSKSAWGVYTGTKSNGVDIIAGNGTCLGKVINTGKKLIAGDLLCSSSYKGFLELQEGLVTVGSLTFDDKDMVMSYTIASVSETVIWEAGEQSRIIAINLMK